MTFEEQSIKGVYLIHQFYAEDSRGSFSKTIHKDAFVEKGLPIHFEESYYSISAKNVVRGMHFQLPPHDHYKLVYVAQGEVLDVVLDLRKKSPTFRQAISVKLKEHIHGLYIPTGCAHGFMALQDNTIMIYNVSTVYNKEADAGILYNSFGFEWPIEENILSKRDKSFQTLKEFETPFLN